jgi:hypothetical protein
MHFRDVLEVAVQRLDVDRQFTTAGLSGCAHLIGGFTMALTIAQVFTTQRNGHGTEVISTATDTAVIDDIDFLIKARRVSGNPKAENYTLTIQFR